MSLITLITATILVMVPGLQAMDVDNGDGNVIKNLPCTMRLNQLVCSGPGESYPGGAITSFVGDNKALLRRMFGENQSQRPVTTKSPVKTSVTLVRSFGHTSFLAAPLIKGQFASAPTFQRFRRDVLEGTLQEMLEREDPELGEDNFEEKSGNSTISERQKRQAEFPGAPEQDNSKSDVCESKVEVTSPFWASNSNGKVRAILNNKEFEQAVHQEICSVTSTLRCNRDCSCEQKYKWHRLLSYDPSNDCAGIFMDWFLFPSCCVCRCNKNPFLG